MNFAYGVIAVVGVLAAITLGFIAMSPDDVIQPRIVSIEEKPTACTLEYVPMCGVDGITYGNSCMLNAADVKLDHDGECVLESEPDNEISIHTSIMPKTAIVGDTLLLEVEFRDDAGNIVDHVNYDIFVTQDGTEILLDPSSHRHPGKHPIHETTALNESDVEIKVIIQGLGHGDKITGPKGIETVMTVIPEMSSKVPAVSAMPAPSETHIVSIPEGSGTPGCEVEQTCFLPNSLEIRVGDTVSWSNDDTAAHTVTSGNISDGHDGMFDSSLFMSGSTFEFTFDKAGKYDYFCMVHPWMIGKIIVNDVKEMVVTESETLTEPIMEPATETLTEPIMEPATETMSLVSIPSGASVPGCDETNECYLPYEITVSVGQTVTWSNDDTAAHTVTSGNIDAGLTGVFDSGLFLSGSTFEFTFDKAGKYDYFCMVHPWMTGIVTVN